MEEGVMPPRGKWICTGNGTHKSRELFPEKVTTSGARFYRCPTCRFNPRIPADRALREIQKAVAAGTYKVDISKLKFPEPDL